MNEKVSIIIPIYNVEKYLNRCLESVVNQTYRALEIILVDDGSPDNCPQMCDEWAARDSRIKVVHKKNGGVGMARNTGLETATGDYLMFVDPDDLLTENAVQILHSRLLVDGTDIVIGKHADIKEDGTLDDSFCRWMSDAVLSKEEVFCQMGQKQRFSVVTWAKLYKRSLFNGLMFPSLTCGEDCWLFPLIIERSRSVSIVNELVYLYLIRADSLLHQKTDKTLLDDIHANLNLSYHLLRLGFPKGAQMWCLVGLSKVSRLKDKSSARKTFNSYFTHVERKQLFHNANIELRMKWFCLQIPILYPLMRAIKHAIRR